MLDNGTVTTALLTEIRDLLQVMAEPQIAERDKRLRAKLRDLCSKSKKRQAAVLLMDGLRPQKDIAKDSSIDHGDLSRLVKAMRADGLLSENKHPELTIRIPSNFFESGE